MKQKFLLFLALLGAFSTMGAKAVTLATNVGLSSAGLSLMDHDNSTLLSGGTSVAGDGDILQFGYYNGATLSNPFAGSFVALTGAGGLNSADATTSIGDLSGNGAGNGSFAFSLTFTTGSTGLPSSGQIMAIRFYNSTSLTTATYYGSAADTDATWASPASPFATVNFSLADPGISWMGNNVAFTGTSTAIGVVPEPNSSLLVICAFGFLALIVKLRRTWISR